MERRRASMHATRYGWVAPLKFRALPGEVDDVLAFAIDEVKNMYGGKIDYDFDESGSTLTFGSKRDVEKVVAFMRMYLKDQDTLSAEGETSVANARLVMARLMEGVR